MSPTQFEKERDAFELHFGDEPLMDFTRDADDPSCYKEEYEQGLWCGWLARAERKELNELTQ